MRFGGESVTIARSPSLRNSSGLVDAPDRRVVGAKREYLLCAAHLLTVEHHALRERRSQAPVEQRRWNLRGERPVQRTNARAKWA